MCNSKANIRKLGCGWGVVLRSDEVWGTTNDMYISGWIVLIGHAMSYGGKFGNFILNKQQNGN